MDAKLLEDIGLTEGEAKVYLALLELGTTTTGAIVNKSGVSASKVYVILDRLAKKALVGHVIKAGVRHFQAAEPKRVMDYLDDQEKEFAMKKQQALRMLPELLMHKKLGAAKRQAEIYDGQKGITNLFKDMLDELKRGEEYHVIGAGRGVEEVKGLKPFFHKFHTERVKRGVRLHMLANASLRDVFVPAARILSKVRFLPEDLTTNLQINFYKDKTIIILWSKESLAFLIHSAEIAASFRHYFDYLWKRAKP